MTARTRKPSERDPLVVQLNAKRIAWGMSIAEWSRRSGVGDSTIRQLLSGRTGGSIGSLYALAAVFDMEIYMKPREH